MGGICKRCDHGGNWNDDVPVNATFSPTGKKGVPPEKVVIIIVDYTHLL